MCKGSVDTFALVINYLNHSWIPHYVTIGLFDIHETMGLSMAGQLSFLFENYDFRHYMIAFVKDERCNLTSW
jgi:hypothetical protein